MKKIKVIALSVLAFVAIASMVFVSCQKNSSSISSQTTNNDTKKSRARTTSNNNYSSLGLDISEVYSTIVSNESINGLIQTNFIQSKLSALGYDIRTSDMIKNTDNISGTSTYTIELINSEGGYAGLIIYPYGNESNKIYSVYFTKYKAVNRVKTPVLISLTSGNNPFEDPEGEGYKIGTKAFKDCMVSSWNNLTNTLGWAILCGIEPISCVSACLIHCSISGMTFQMTPEQALKWLCDNGMIDCNGVYHDNNYTFVSL
jgi:hypothetical protein